MVPGGCYGADTIKFIEKALGCKRTSRIKPGYTLLKNGRNPPFLGRLRSSVETSGGANGARGRSRTADTVIFSHVLYQLSYPGIAVAELAARASARWKRAYGEGLAPCPAPT